MEIAHQANRFSFFVVVVSHFKKKNLFNFHVEPIRLQG